MVVINEMAIAVSLALSTPGASVASEARQSSADNAARWEVDYGEMKCRLIRHLGTGSAGGRLEIARDWSLGGFSWVLVGGNLPIYSSATAITVTLRPSLATHQFEANPYRMDLRGTQGVVWSDADNRLADALRNDQQITVTGAKKLNLTFDLTNALSALKALEACDKDLIAGWGFDPSQQLALLVQAKPSGSPGRWVMVSDYPRADLSQKNEGTTAFLLNVGADGGVTGCRTIGSSGFPSLDKRACELLMARAAFEPAKDRDGRPVASFYLNKVRWQVPR